MRRFRANASKISEVKAGRNDPIRQDLESGVEPVEEAQVKSRRKKDGAFYTLAFITRYIVEQTLVPWREFVSMARSARWRDAGVSTRDACAPRSPRPERYLQYEPASIQERP